MRLRRLLQILVSGAPTDTKTRVAEPPQAVRPDEAFDPRLVRQREQAEERRLRAVD